MKLTKEEATNILYNENEDWSELHGERELFDERRWYNIFRGIFLHKPSGIHYEMYYEKGASELQEDHEPFYDDVTAVEVRKQLVTIEKWVAVDD